MNSPRHASGFTVTHRNMHTLDKNAHLKQHTSTYAIHTCKQAHTHDTHKCASHLENVGHESDEQMSEAAGMGPERVLSLQQRGRALWQHQHPGHQGGVVSQIHQGCRQAGTSQQRSSYLYGVFVEV